MKEYLDNLTQLVPIIHFEPRVGIAEHQTDANLTVETNAGPIKYLVEFKQHFQHQDVMWVTRTLIDMAGKRGVRWLLMAPYIRKEQAQVLVENAIDYIDLAGNAHLHRRGFLVHIEGKRPAEQPKEMLHRCWTPTGLRVLFLLLTQRDALGWTQRKIADIARTRQATIHYVLQALRENGYLERVRPKDWRLTRRGELIAAWVERYATALYPRLLLKRYRPQKRQNDELVAAIGGYCTQQGIVWALTGAEGAYQLTRHYRDETIAVFIDTIPPDLEKGLRCLPDPEGPLTMLQYFGDTILGWPRKNKRLPIAHPLLIYAELLRAGTQRARDTALIIREKYLKELDRDD